MNSIRRSRSRAPGRPVTIQVVSLDWKWLFIYPDQRVASVNHAHRAGRYAAALPADIGERDERFFIPQLGSMIYTMNGMTTRLHLRADHPGDLSGPLLAFQRRRLSGHVV